MTPELILMESVRNGSPVPRALFHESCDETVSTVLLSSGFSVAEVEELLAELDTLLFENDAFYRHDPEKGAFGDFLLEQLCRCVRRRGEHRVPDRAKWDEEWKKQVLRQSLLKLRREMTPDEYLAFEVYVVEGKPAREAAVLSSLSPGMVYLVKTRALKRLRVLRHEFEAV